VPSTLFTDPELAHVGLTEKEAAARGLEFRVLQVPITPLTVPRARTSSWPPPMMMVCALGHRSGRPENSLLWSRLSPLNRCNIVNTIYTIDKRRICLSVRQPFLDFNARSGRDLIKTLMLDDTSDTLVGQKAFLGRLKSSCILTAQVSSIRHRVRGYERVLVATALFATLGITGFAAPSSGGRRPYNGWANRNTGHPGRNRTAGCSPQRP
jgi:hypothetical protein